MSRKIADLVPEMQEKAKEFAAKMAEVGIPFMFTRTRATVAEQTALYAQGRQDLAEVNRLRAIVGWSPIRARENSYKVTWTMKSRHLDGEAFDIAILSDGQPTWDAKVNVNHNDIPDYVEAGQIAESIGLTWGGRFKNADLPHLELPKEG
jgi:peptidoglycan L-alanyl-D-glutamate endopeptidase CwlK